MTPIGSTQRHKIIPFDSGLREKLKKIVARDGAEQTMRSLGTSRTLLFKALSLGFARRDSVERLSSMIQEMS